MDFMINTYEEISYDSLASLCIAKSLLLKQGKSQLTSGVGISLNSVLILAEIENNGFSGCVCVYLVKKNTNSLRLKTSLT